MTERKYGRRWTRLRDRIMRERDWTCEQCGQRSYMSSQVHHKTYERFGHELDTDLEVLCRRCHYERHSFMGEEGFEPTQHEAPGLQPGPALPLRRSPVAAEDYREPPRSSQIASICLASTSLPAVLGFEPPYPGSPAPERAGTQREVGA